MPSPFFHRVGFKYYTTEKSERKWIIIKPMIPKFLGIINSTIYKQLFT